MDSNLQIMPDPKGVEGIRQGGDEVGQSELWWKKKDWL
jgi:hypothetical protein